jgi:hypothetical protein
MQIGCRGGSPTANASLSPESAHNWAAWDISDRDQTAWLGMWDSNSETSTQIIPLKDRTDLPESSRILATETIRV